MWAPLSVALVIGVLGQATAGAVGVAIGYAVALLVVLGITVALRRGNLASGGK